MQDTKAVDKTRPDGKWTFDDEVTLVFDNMLQRSIPQFETMRSACLELASHYRQEGTWILDLGCSRGGAIAELVDRFGCHNKYYGCDVSEPMLEAARERFGGYIENGLAQFENLDLRNNFPAHGASVIMSVLTLQFTPIEYRQKILRNIWLHLTTGGALILVEKILGSDADIDSVMVEQYYRLKAKNGYSQEDIERKRLSLEGVLVPVPARFNEELLRMAGFNHIDCFWRWMNFAGWVAVKE